MAQDGLGVGGVVQTLLWGNLERLEASLSAKEKGKQAAAANNSEILDRFREIALWLGRFGARVSIEDVRVEAHARGIRFTPGNWMGSVFSTGDWRAVGWEPSRHEKGHGRPVRVWQRLGL